MEGLGAAASVLTIIEIAKEVYSSCQKYILGVKHARQEIQRLSAEVLELSDILEKVDELLKSPSASELPTLHLLKKPNGTFQQCENQLRDILSKLEPAEGMRTVGARALKWPFKSERVSSTIEALERQKSAMELALNTDHIAVTLNVDTAVSQLRDDLSTAKIQEGETRMTEKDKELRDKVVFWLQTTDPSTNHVNQRRKHQATTGGWFVHGKELVQWRTKPNSLLWLHGTSGCGKTVLSSTIIEHIRGNYLKDQGFAIAYYYFDFNDPEKRKAINLVSSIISQLCAHRASLCSEMKDLYTSYQSGAHKPLLCDLIKALGCIVKEFNSVYLVIDALDECPEKDEQRDELLGIIEKIHNWDMPQLRILATSRRESGIADALAPLLTTPAVCIQSSRVDADIQLHVQNELKSISKQKKWSADLVTDIEDALVDGANGMFRWISCQLDTLKQCLKPSQIRQKLKSLPKDLEATYARILLELPEDYREDACTALWWLCYSERPLELKELVEALLLPPSKDPPFNPEDRLSDPDRVLQILPGLLSISKESRGVEMIRLAHFSVKEYLVGSNIGKGPTAGFGTTPEQAHQFITESCLVYILEYSEAKERTNSRQDLATFPLLKYACRFWYLHRRAFVREDETPTGPQALSDTLMMRLLLSIDKTKSWLQVHEPDKRWKAPFKDKGLVHWNDPGICLYMAAFMGLCEAVRKLLDHGVDPNAPRTSLHAISAPYGYPLRVAACRGQTKTCQMLISHGARVDDVGTDAPTALLLAAEAGHVSTVRLLLQNGANVDIGNGTRGGTALYTATRNEHEELMRVLLEHHADVNASTQDGNTSLTQAAIYGKCDMMRSLLDYGADIESPNQTGMTSLIYVVKRGYVNAVTLLHEWGANPNTKDRSGRMSLHWAAGCEDYAVVKKLLELGADIEAVDDGGKTPLHAGIRVGNERIVRLLLEQGANVNAEDDKRRTPLHIVARWVCEPILRLLLEQGANVDAEDYKRLTPLHKAITARNVSVVRLLLKQGANENAEDKCRAIKLQSESTVRLLLESGANVNAEDNERLTSLHKAATWGLESTVRLLLEWGANVNAEDNERLTPLHKITIVGHDSTTKSALEREATDDRKYWRGTPLNDAIKDGKKDTVRLLLKWGANADAKDSAMLTPKDWAAQIGDMEVLTLKEMRYTRKEMRYTRKEMRYTRMV